MDDDPASAKDLFCKTKLCKFYAVGRCKQGRRCSFAHGNKNIAPMPDFYHTRMCPSFVDTGFCKNGDSCSYAHDQRDLRTGVTKATSNGANLAYLPTSVSQPRARANLQQLLVSYGVPQAPEKLTTSSSMPQQPFIMAEPEAEPYISGGASSTSTSRERHVFQSENRTLAPTNEKLAQAHSESAITNELNLLMQMQMISHRHWKDEDSRMHSIGAATVPNSVQRLQNAPMRPLAASIPPVTMALQDYIGRMPQQDQDLAKDRSPSQRLEQNPSLGWPIFSVKL
jgi:hypothetical protein